MANFSIGDLISFTYPAVHQQGTRAHTKNPTVLVLHPGFMNPAKSPNPLTHAIAWHEMDENQRNLIKMIVSPAFQLQHYPVLQQRNPALASQFDSIMGSINIDMIASPKAFYDRVLRPLLQRGALNARTSPDSYRLYRPDKMTGVRIVQTAKSLMGEAVTPENLAAARGSRVPLTPTAPKLTVFQKFKNKFEHMRGPRFNTRLPVFDKFRRK